MTYSFRIRFNHSRCGTINTDLSKIFLLSPKKDILLSLNAASPDKTIQYADQWSLIGEGYKSKEEAWTAGAQFQEYLSVVFAQMRIGVDFGERAPKSGLTNYGEEYFGEQFGKKILTNTHGLMVYPSEPKPNFLGMNMNGFVSKPLELFKNKFCSIINVKPKLTDQERLAYLLFNASFFQPTSDSRFLLLVMAIETFIKPKPRTQEAIEYVTSFIKQLENSSLGENEKKSLAGSLKWLQYESINQAGKQLVEEKLAGKVYQEKSPAQFFSTIYSLRSNLVHGNIPYPTFDEVTGIVTLVEEFVSDLLTSTI